MLFNIELDHGTVLEGYVIPDGFSDVAAIRVFDGGDDLGYFPCDQSRPAVVASGRHETGMVGFKLDSSKIPSIADMPGISIFDEKTGVLIYRRPRLNQIDRKIIRLETQLVPSIKFDRTCAKYFQYNLFAAERLGHETTLQAFHLHGVDSIWLSGRLLMRNYDDFLDKGFDAIVLISDPFYELALRILILKRLSAAEVSFLGERDKLIFSHAVEYFADVDLSSSKSLNSALKRAPSKVTDVLRSPLTKQFVCKSPEQRPVRGDIAAAIDLLSRFKLVGHKSNLSAFQRQLADFLGAPEDEASVAQALPPLQSLVDLLRNIPLVEILLEEDLIFDYFVRQAISD
ncbi:hypothetical protein [Agrobacterium rosae]